MLIVHPDSHVHSDLRPEHVAWALKKFQNKDGFFKTTVEMPKSLPALDDALYGPVAGDPPVAEADVVYIHRPGGKSRLGKSRMIDRPMRKTRMITVIAGPHDGHPMVVYAMHGGYSAEREPFDEDIKTPAQQAAADAFWSQHALATGKEAKVRANVPVRPNPVASPKTYSRRNNGDTDALRRAKAGDKNLMFADLSGADLSGLDLTGVNLTGSDLYGARLVGANLTNAILVNANLHDADLTGANLTGVRLSGTTLPWRKLEQMSIVGISFNENGQLVVAGHERNNGEQNMARNPQDEDDFDWTLDDDDDDDDDGYARNNAADVFDESRFPAPDADRIQEIVRLHKERGEPLPVGISDNSRFLPNQKFWLNKLRKLVEADVLSMNQALAIWFDGRMMVHPDFKRSIQRAERYAEKRAKKLQPAAEKPAKPVKPAKPASPKRVAQGQRLAQLNRARRGQEQAHRESVTDQEKLASVLVSAGYSESNARQIAEYVSINHPELLRRNNGLSDSGREKQLSQVRDAMLHAGLPEDDAEVAVDIIRNNGDKPPRTPGQIRSAARLTRDDVPVARGELNPEAFVFYNGIFHRLTGKAGSRADWTHLVTRRETTTPGWGISTFIFLLNGAEVARKVFEDAPESEDSPVRENKRRGSRVKRSNGDY